jgi:Putative MetA-pathway of phenol degradation
VLRSPRARCRDLARPCAGRRRRAFGVGAAAWALALGALGVAAAEEPEPVGSDRAGAATSTSTVGRGVLQLEAGLAYERERLAARPSDRRFTLEAALRGGLTERLELRVEGEPLVRLRGAEDETGHGDFTLSAKYRFLDAADGSWMPSLGVLPFVKLPVTEEPIGSGKTDFGALLLSSFALPGQVSVDLDAGLAAVGQSRPGGYVLQAIVAVGASRDLTDWLVLFSDVIYASREERASRDSVVLDAGVIWRAGRDVAVDASVVTSLTGPGPDWTVRAGVSLRFGR